MSLWKPGKILIVFFDQPTWRPGFEYRGVGLFKLMGGMPELGFDPHWGVYHLGSGHFVIDIQADEPEVFEIATEIADAGDWTFDGPGGWQNQFPDLWERLGEIQARHPGRLTRPGTHENHEAAFEVLIQRENQRQRPQRHSSRRRHRSLG